MFSVHSTASAPQKTWDKNKRNGIYGSLVYGSMALIFNAYYPQIRRHGTGVRLCRSNIGPCNGL